MVEHSNMGAETAFARRLVNESSDALIALGLDGNITAHHLREFQAERKGNADAAIFGGGRVGIVGEDVEQAFRPGQRVADLGVGDADHDDLILVFKSIRAAPACPGLWQTHDAHAEK